MKRGDIVTIYHDPLTKQKVEGKAQLFKFGTAFDWYSQTLGCWQVRFLKDSQHGENENPIVSRYIKKGDKPMTISNSAVAERYADGATDGASKNMYIQGDTIYSYGVHFPIAKRISGGYVFNSSDYSVSTARHKSDVWCVIHKNILWELPGCDLDAAMHTYTDRILSALKSIPTSRQRFPTHFDLLEFNFNKAIEASEKLCQDIQPLYNLMDTEVAALAIKRIKKEGKLPGVMLTIFGKAKFLGQDTRAKAILN